MNERDSLRTDFEFLGILYLFSSKTLLRASGPLWAFFPLLEFLRDNLHSRHHGTNLLSFCLHCYLSKTFDFSLMVLKSQLSNFNVILFLDAVLV